jgi:DNA-binding MarR family transcriptional regulator
MRAPSAILSTVVDNPAPAAPPQGATPRRLGAALLYAWLGYQTGLDAEMAEAGFADRRLPDGRVLRLCAGSDDLTISDIGRTLGITRQGASKIVASLGERGYVSVGGSALDARGKIVTLTPQATDYLAAHSRAADRIERRLRRQLGPEAFGALEALLTALGPGEDVPPRDYIRAHRSDVDHLA